MAVSPMQLGVVFWAEKDPATHLAEIESFGLKAAQLGVPPSMDPVAALDAWKAAVAASDITFTGAVVAYEGEDYANLAKVHETVGFTAPGFAEERIARTQAVSDFAAALGLTSLSLHIGFVPEDTSAPLYTELLGIARTLCDLCAANGQDFVLETGQESASTLLAFLGAVAKPNLKVNFDPANMVLYGSGDPLEALALLQDNVLSVHCKDGVGPTAEGQLGKEVALGDGDVDFPGFLALLKTIGYNGALVIEREAPDAAQRKIDIELGITRLNEWKKSLA